MWDMEFDSTLVDHDDQKPQWGSNDLLVQKTGYGQLSEDVVVVVVFVEFELWPNLYCLS